MTELRPILGDDPTEDEKRLLDSARLDVPSRAGRRRTLAAMGVAAAVTTTAGTGGAAVTTASAGLIVKWVALGALGSTVTLGAIGSLTPVVRGWGRGTSAVAPRPAPAASYAAKVTPGISSAPRVAPVEAPPSLSAEPSPSSLAAPSARREPSVPVRVTPSPVAPMLPPAADDTLMAEVTALDEARRGLAAGSPASALLTLDSYDRRFTLRRLGPEASVLRIEALIAGGRFSQARQLGDELLAAEPDGAYAQHVRSLLSRAGP